MAIFNKANNSQGDKPIQRLRVLRNKRAFSVISTSSRPKDASPEFRQHWEKAQKGEANSQYWLGDQYRTGLRQRVDKDYLQAFYWYKMSADNGGLAKAQFMVGLCYEKAYGAAEDYEMAKKHYLLAADQGDSIAKARLQGTAMEVLAEKQGAEDQPRA